MKSGATFDFTASKLILVIDGKRMKFPTLSITGLLNGGLRFRRGLGLLENGISWGILVLAKSCDIDGFNKVVVGFDSPLL